MINKNLKFKIKNLPRRGFTIIEILVVIFLFSALVLVSSSSLVTGFLSGTLRSSSDKSLNRDLSYTMDIIRQKMANANDESALKSMPIGNYQVYGFKYYDTEKTLVFVTNKQLSTNTCQLIKWDEGTKNLYVKEEDCDTQTYLNISSATPTTGPAAEDWKKANSDGISITEFTIDAHPLDFAAINIPYFNITIVGEDTTTGAKAKLIDTFSIPYATVERWVP